LVALSLVKRGVGHGETTCFFKKEKFYVAQAP